MTGFADWVTGTESKLQALSHFRKQLKIAPDSQAPQQSSNPSHELSLEAT